MDLQKIHLFDLFDMLCRQQDQEEHYRKHRVDPSRLIRPDVLTRFAIHHDGGVIYSTDAASVPVNDGYTERCEGIHLGKRALKRFYLVTIQAGHEALPESIADLEASLLYKLLPVPGSHYGTSAQADRSFQTSGLLYVNNLKGVKQRVILIPGEFSAFYAGHGHLAIMAGDRFHVIAIDVFLDRARNGRPLIQPDEGRARQPGELLIRGWQQKEPLMAVLADQGIRYYDAHGQEHPQFMVNMGPDRVLEVPGVDRIGLQDKRRITITLRRDLHLDAGSITRSALASPSGKRSMRPKHHQPGSYSSPCSPPSTPLRAPPSLDDRTF